MPVICLGRAIPSIGLSPRSGFGALDRMEPTEAEKLKGERAKKILYVSMVVLIGGPVLLFFVLRAG
jgi:hypothetical protein